MIKIYFDNNKRIKFLFVIQDQHWEYYPVIDRSSSGYYWSTHYIQNVKTRKIYQITKNGVISYDDKYSSELIYALNDSDGHYRNARLILSKRFVNAIINQLIGSLMKSDGLNLYMGAESITHYDLEERSKSWEYYIEVVPGPTLKKSKSNFFYSHEYVLNGFEIKHFLKVDDDILEMPYSTTKYLNSTLIERWIFFGMFPPKVLGYKNISWSMMKYLTSLTKGKEVSYREIEIAHTLRKLLA